MSSLDLFFRPRSVAVVGASRDAASLSGTLLVNLRDSFRGRLWAVNPHADNVLGVSSCRSLLEIPEPIELAFLALPARHALTAARDCAAKGIRAAVVISAGFSETGADGRDAEERLAETFQSAGIRFLGPNCFGVVDTGTAGLNGTFAIRDPLPGRTAIATQSGSLAFLLPSYLRQSNLGISSLVSLGNKADLGEVECLEHWGQDPATDRILLYLESLQRPRALLQAASRVSRDKPVLVLKAGRTSAGMAAASSHTAALATPSRIADGLFRQAGMIQVAELCELIELSVLVSQQTCPAGRRLAVVTNSGGPAVLCADVAGEYGLSLPELPGPTQLQLRRGLSPVANARNPIDLAASVDPREFHHCLTVLLASDQVDAVLTVFSPRIAGSSEGIATVLQEVAGSPAARGKTLGAVFLPPENIRYALAVGTPPVPTFAFPEGAARALAKAADYAAWRVRPPGKQVHWPDVDRIAGRWVATEAQQRLGGAGGWLNPAESHALCAAFGIPCPGWALVTGADEALMEARRLAGPVVIKAAVPGLLHKSRHGGVRLNVLGDSAVRAAYADVCQATGGTEVLVQEFVGGEVELLVGCHHTPATGHVISFGLGGTAVELLGDVSFRFAPLTDRDAEELIAESRWGRRAGLDFREEQLLHQTTMRDMLLRVSELVTTVPEIVELDCNPLKVDHAGRAWAVDVRVRLEERG